MNGKSSNLSKWVFVALAAITVVIAVLFYLVVGSIKPNFDHGEPTPRADLFLNWGYILIILGVVVALVSVIYTAVVKGVNFKKILIAIGAIVVIGVVALLMSKGSFGVEYATGEHVYSGTTHGLVEWGLNFFYFTFGVSILCILYSVIKSGK